MHQWRIRALAEGRHETVGGQLLAGARAGRLGGQRGFQRLGIDVQILGEAIDKQVAKPHRGKTSGHKARIILVGRLQANPELTLWKA
ncbi:hypothetical protein D9M70_543120 [compost metagenome]